MEITDIECIPVEIGIKPREEPGGIAPYISSDRGQETDLSDHYAADTRTRTIVRLETKAHTGWGEMLVPLKSVNAATAIVSDVIEPRIVGAKVSDANSLIESIYHPYVKIDPILGAVEMAMLDALGKHKQVALSDLLGGSVSDSVSFAYSVGILDPEESREHVRRALDMGFDVVKTKADEDWKHSLNRLIAMDDEADGSLEFRVDPNQSLASLDAVRFASALEDEGIYLQYLEQPVQTESFETMKSLRNRLRTPIAANEDTYVQGNLHHLLRENAIDAAVVDLVPTGGIRAVREVASMCRKAGVSVAHHSSFDLGIKTAAVLHTVSSTPAIDLPADTVYYAWKDTIISDPFEISDGSLSVPEGPGLGIEVDRSKLDEYRIDE